jgi:hypothetical protein
VPVGFDSQEAVGVVQLVIHHEQAVAAEVVEGGDDHALGPALGNLDIGGDGVGTVEDRRVDALREVLDIPAPEGPPGLVAQRRHDPEEGRQPGEQRGDVVSPPLPPTTWR